MRFKRIHQICQGWCQDALSRVPAGAIVVAIASVTITSLVVGIKQLGVTEFLELKAYDFVVRLQPDGGTDPRLLIVAITEDDIRRLNRANPDDRTLTTVIQTLERYQPEVIGLDLHRNVPEGDEADYTALLDQLRASNVITITKLGEDGQDGIPAPVGLAPEQVGFNDLLVDPDGVIRRGLLFGKDYASFAMQIAFRYLEGQGIYPMANPADDTQMQLGPSVFVPLQRTAGGYQTIDDRGYQILLNYRSSRHLARQVTLSQVLDNELEPDWIRGKIVLIGTTAPSRKDLFYTPYSAAERTEHQMAGVEIHAQMVSQFISAGLGERPLMWFWPEWCEWLWILGWAATGSAIAWFIRHPVLLGLSSTALLSSLVGAGFIVLSHHGWVPLASPAIATLVTTGAVVAYRAQQAQQQQQMVMTLLGQNTSPEIATALWNNRDRILQSGKLPGQRLTATMLFTDIRGFSTISEKMTPESLLDLLNEYLEVMTQEIQNHHGIINKFTGDGMLAVFGVPVPRTTTAEIAEDAYNAVLCALRMGDRLDELNRSWQERGIHTIQMRVGIFTGPVVAGSLGGKNRLEYGIIGDSVNVASRLESCAKDRQVGNCRILIPSETLRYIDDKFQVEPWGAMELRGKQQLVEVYRVISHLADIAAIASPSPAAETAPLGTNSSQPLDPAHGQVHGQVHAQTHAQAHAQTHAQTHGQTLSSPMSPAIGQPLAQSGAQPLAQSAAQSLSEWERKKSTADLETKENSLNLWE